MSSSCAKNEIGYTMPVDGRESRSTYRKYCLKCADDSIG